MDAHIIHPRDALNVRSNETDYTVITVIIFVISVHS